MPKLLRVKIFTKHADQGNLAGVVLDAETLTEKEMQAIAVEVEASETAFVLPSSKANLRIRWFTPNTEVGVCVHATLGALAALFESKRIPSGSVTIETMHSTFEGEIRDNVIFIQVPCYSINQSIPDVDKILSLFPLQRQNIVGTPRVITIFQDRELMIEVQSLEDLKHLEPNVANYQSICKSISVTGMTIFTKQTFQPENHIHTREFAPLYGYLEDPLCGMAAGAIATYLGAKELLRIEQGNFCGTSGVILVENRNSKIRIGGEWIVVS